MRRSSFALTVALTLAACGARSPFAEPSAASPAPDVAVPDVAVPDVAVPDVAVPDAPAPDVPVPATACALRILSGPTLVHEERGGYLTAPALTFRPPDIDAPATFIAQNDLRHSEVAARTLTLERDRSLTLGPRSPLAPTDGPAHFATAGSQLGACLSRSDGSSIDSPLLFARWFTYAPVGGDLTVLRDGAECVGIAHATTPWLLALRGPAGPRLLTLGADGMPVAPPRPALTMLASSASTHVAVSTFGGGFAWASSADASGALELGTLDAEGTERHALVGGFRGTTEPAVSEARSGDAVLVAGTSDSGSLVAASVRPDGSVLFRSPPLTPLWFSTAAPTVTDATFGVVVAALAYGDDDPQHGVLEATLLRPDGSVSGVPVRVPIYVGSLTRGASQLAAVAMRDYVLLHWTGTRDDRSQTAVSYAMVLGCE